MDPVLWPGRRWTSVTKAARVSYFAKLENRQRWGPITQRAIDVTYLPDALLRESNPAGPIDDYWAFVARLASEVALSDGQGSVVASGEFGYAPNTQSESGAGFSGSGDVGGTAWHFEVSWMNFQPGHSFGINYGRGRGRLAYLARLQGQRRNGHAALPLATCAWCATGSS